MYLNADINKEAKYYKVYNKKTGREIQNVIWADDGEGIYCQLLTDRSGNLIDDGFGRVKKVTVVAEIYFEKIGDK